jgi:general secretion pathway protein D
MKLSRRSKLMHFALVGLMTHSALLPILISSKANAQNGNDELDRLFEEEEFDQPAGSFNQAPPAPPAPPADFGAPPAEPPTGSFDAQPPTGTGAPSGSTGSFAGRSRAPKAGRKAKVDMSQANIEDITNENYPDLIESFDYPNAEITDIAKAISQLTGKNFIIDPGVRGKISIIAPTQISVAEAYKAFLSALAINGFTVVPSGKFLKIKSARNAQRDSIETYSGQYYPNADLMITRIIHLKHISAEEVNKRLRILPSKDGEMTPYEPTNSLIISDYGANIERIMKIINDLDKPGFEEQLAVIQIRYSKSKDLADLVNQIINKDTSKGGAGGAPAFGAGVPRFRSRGGSAQGGTPEELSLVASDDRTNAIIVVGNNAGIQKVRDLVKKLDYKLDPSEAGGVFVYYVKYGEAEKIVSTLSGLAGGSSSPASSPAANGGFGAPGRLATPLAQQAVFGGDVKFAFDKNTNSIVTTASKQDYETVQSLLAKLDIPRDQVFVEGIIMEMDTQKTRDWNPTVYALDSGSNGIGRTGFSRKGSLQAITNPVNDSGTILGFGSGAVSMNIAGTPVVIPSLLAFIQAIQQNTESNILSTPKILALDNEESTIEVGDEIPVSQNSTLAANGVAQQSTQREKATIKLIMTPFIRPDSDAVRLKISELSVRQPTQVQAVGDALASTNVSIAERTIKTNIVVNNGDTAVLGGLIRDEETLQETKVPILGDIPVLGWLFKSSKMDKRKINLVVFLTPKIVRTNRPEQNRALLNRQVNERVDWIKRNFSGRDPYGRKVDALPRGVAASEIQESDEPIHSKSNKSRKPQSLGSSQSGTANSKPSGKKMKQ